MSGERLTWPLPRAIRASVTRGVARAAAKAKFRQRTILPKEHDDGPHQGTRVVPRPTLPRLRFMERPELPPYETWINTPTKETEDV
jgi:hypothetical protein